MVKPRIPGWAVTHAHTLHELASQARSFEEHEYVEGAVTSIQLDGLARLFNEEMKEYVKGHATLLAALVAAHEILAPYFTEDGSRHGPVENVKGGEVVAQLRTAIANACGEQP